MELFTRKGGITIHYHTAGEGYPVVLIHTAYDNAAIFKDLSKKLAESFQVVLIDLRGHGYSDKPRIIKFNEFADDIILLLDYLYIEQAAFIGHELGANIIADLAVRYPEYCSSLTLVNPTLIEGELPAERLFRKYANEIRNWEDNKQEKFLGKHRYYKPRHLNKYLKHIEDTNAISTKEEIEAVEEVFKTTGIAQSFDQVTQPTYIISGEHGEQVTSVEAKEVADLVGQPQFEVFNASSLYPFIEEQEHFISQVSSFIKAHIPQQ